ncbi:hypothetical protein NAEGRDRAFT_81885 [Naegleria gruberi]|uniref:Uncharacterized protein n=1 Tax=Naegleria gruberi TaxID=5762 RepID=D2W007_NAEGR|nr:uncharacterized protein NAEGRDRAFT_81885 [Naegleria gruberi]EFC37663.1 hypothetical protein NAEGRDRAFT_81885 [Naegleria gruberi]|eukprot:XP_002670407.1 hypothetical protein NAEGRDRAFT_81885 [Naegleria gruberi strain NEG-M]
MDFIVKLSSSSCYYTDDPIPRYTSACSKSNVCSPPDFTGNNYLNTVSFSIPNTDPGYSTSCYNLAFEAFRRFKVCKLDPPTYSGFITVKYQGSSSQVSVVNNQASIPIGYTGLNFIMDLNSTTLPFVADYSVIDLTSKSDFYLLPSSVVNGFNVSDISKIGWIKVSNIKNSEIKYNCQSPRGSCNFDVTLPELSEIQSMVHFSTGCESSPAYTVASFDNASITRRILEAHAASRASFLAKFAEYSDLNLQASIIASKDVFHMPLVGLKIF